MHDSIAQPDGAIARLELSGWKNKLSWIAAILLSLLFLVSGIWKITDAPGAAVRMAQARIPENLSLAAAVLFGIAETFAGVLLLVPRFRRWGAWLAGFMLLAFLVYFAMHYETLRGEECNCFPWIKRVVGPGFFVGDAVMLALALMAGIWAKPPAGVRIPLVILGAVSVFAVVSYGVAATRQTGTRAPPTITVDGKPVSTRQGKMFLYFFDPECLHCLQAGKRMAQMNWGDTRFVGVAVQQPRFAQNFMQDTGLNAKGGLSPDVKILRETFSFTDVPAGVALENGTQVAAISKFEGEEPGDTLKKLGFIY